MATQKNKTQRSPAEIITDMCSLLENFGVTKILAVYNGSARAGQNISIRCYYGVRDEDGAKHFQGARRVFDDEAVLGVLVTSLRPLQHVLAELDARGDGSAALVKQQEANDMIYAFQHILPVGWAAGLGSHGTINVNVVTRKIAIYHNARVEKVESSLISFNDDYSSSSVRVDTNEAAA